MRSKTVRSADGTAKVSNTKRWGFWLELNGGAWPGALELTPHRARELGMALIQMADEKDATK